jgi:hypothetical protein
MERILVTIFLLWTFVVGMTGCTPDTIAKAEKSSAKLASYADRGVNVTRDLYQKQFIDLATKDQIASGFIKLAQAGIAFDAAVNNAKAVYGTNVPSTEIERLFATFDSQVVTQFVAVLASFKLISNAPALEAVIASLKVAVLVIADAFGKKVVVEAKIS